MSFNRDTLREAEDLLNIDLAPVINNFLHFDDNDRIRIKEYYKGVVKERPEKSFDRLSKLQTKVQNVLSVMGNKNYLLKNIKYFDLISFFDNIQESLNFAENSDRFYKAIKLNGNYYSDIKKTESLISTIDTALIKNNQIPNEQSLQTMFENRIKEEDYDSVKKPTFKINLFSDTEFEIESIIDVVNEETILGRDIKSKLTFKNNDLEIVEGDECLRQCGKILLELKKGDHLFFFNDGISDDIMGNKYTASSLPVLYRQIAALISTDDIFSSFEVREVNFNESALEITIDLVSRTSTRVTINKEI